MPDISSIMIGMSASHLHFIASRRYPAVQHRSPGILFGSVVPKQSVFSSFAVYFSRLGISGADVIGSCWCCSRWQKGFLRLGSWCWDGGEEPQPMGTTRPGGCVGSLSPVLLSCPVFLGEGWECQALCGRRELSPAAYY